VSADGPAATRVRRIIDDAQDPALDRFRWRDPQLDPRQARSDAPLGLFVAEGDLVVERALEAGFTLHSVLVDELRAPPVLDRVPIDVPVFLARPAVTKALTGFGVVLDIVALFHRRAATPLTDLVAGARRLLLVDSVDNPANVGAIVRSAAALGVDALALDPTSADPFARRSTRASMGAVFSMPCARTESLPGGLAPFRDAGFRLLALTPDLGATPIDSITLAPDERAALLLGSERSGLDPSVLACTEPVRIPMARGIDSLNVAAAAAVACYVLAR